MDYEKTRTSTQPRRWDSTARPSAKAGSGWRPCPGSIASGGPEAEENIVHRFELDGPKLARKETDPRGDGRGGAIRGKSHFRSGLALDPQRNVLCALDIDYGTITALDLEW